jgi:hypothetical protein
VLQQRAPKRVGGRTARHVSVPASAKGDTGVQVRVRLAFLVAAFAFAGCGSGTVPTPINSAISSGDLAAFCQGTAPSAADLQAAASALAAAAAGSGFTMDNAAARFDSALAGLRGLSLTGEGASARDALVAQLEKLKGELPNPSADTIRAASQAAVAFNTAKSTFCK